MNIVQIYKALMLFNFDDLSSIYLNKVRFENLYYAIAKYMIHIGIDERAICSYLNNLEVSIKNMLVKNVDYSAEKVCVEGLSSKEARNLIIDAKRKAYNIKPDSFSLYELINTYGSDIFTEDNGIDVSTKIDNLIISKGTLWELRQILKIICEATNEIKYKLTINDVKLKGVYNYLSKLKGKDYIIYIHRYMNNMPLSDIAKLYNCDKSIIYSHTKLNYNKLDIRRFIKNK